MDEAALQAELSGQLHAAEKSAISLRLYGGAGAGKLLTAGPAINKLIETPGSLGMNTRKAATAAVMRTVTDMERSAHTHVSSALYSCGALSGRVLREARRLYASCTLHVRTGLSDDAQPSTTSSASKQARDSQQQPPQREDEQRSTPASSNNKSNSSDSNASRDSESDATSESEESEAESDATSDATSAPQTPRHHANHAIDADAGDADRSAGEPADAATGDSERAEQRDPAALHASEPADAAANAKLVEEEEIKPPTMLELVTAEGTLAACVTLLVSCCLHSSLRARVRLAHRIGSWRWSTASLATRIPRSSIR